MAECIDPKGQIEPSDEWDAREVARRHRDQDGRPLSPVMKTAVTARELAHGSLAREPRK
jgi:hypothetical protein